MKLIQNILILLLLLPISGMAQVTIGNEQQVESGMLLQLKNTDTELASGANATSGMVLPRVALSSLTRLDMGDNVITDPTELLENTGLMVYNTTVDLPGGLCHGAYVWDAEKWTRMREPCLELDFKIDPSNLVFYKSTPFPKPFEIVLPIDPIITVSFALNANDTNEIDWSLGSGLPTARSADDKYTLQPPVNTTDKVLTSIIDVSVTYLGVVFVKQLNVTQFPFDIQFRYSHTNAYPAQTNTYLKDIIFEDKWTPSVGANPDNMLTNIVTSEHNVGDTYQITLANNDSFKEREATLQVSSPSLDYVPQTMKIKQSFAPLYLLLDNSESNIDYSFGTPASAVSRTIKMNTNAGWAITQRDANFDKVLTSASNIPAQGAVQAGSTSAVTDYQGNLNLITNHAYIGYGAAGTTYSTVIRLESRNHDGENPIERTIRATRAVQWIHDGTAITPGTGSTISAGGISVNLKLNTNRVIWIDAIQRSSGERLLLTNTVAAEYGIRDLNFGIGANRTGSTRIVDMRYTYNFGTYTVIASYTQPSL